MEVCLTRNAQNAIQGTLLAAGMMKGFWDRWLAHGAEPAAVEELFGRAVTLEQWEHVFERRALACHAFADTCRRKGKLAEAERHYRLSSLYYNALQWIYPERGAEKASRLSASVDVSVKADRCSPYLTEYDRIIIDGRPCLGRVRIPSHAAGCVVMINPIDSAKEELYTYETDFLDCGFAVVSFDGPGQGATFVLEGLTASRDRWERFSKQVIDYAYRRFPNLSLHLFGTSSGGAWALRQSEHNRIARVVSVSPALPEPNVRMPDYFTYRMDCLSGGAGSILPDLALSPAAKPVYLFHGRKDVMVSKRSMDQVLGALPAGAKYKEYEDEGHCCNDKLGEIRRLAAAWYRDGEGVIER